MPVTVRVIAISKLSYSDIEAATTAAAGLFSNNSIYLKFDIMQCETFCKVSSPSKCIRHDDFTSVASCPHGNSNDWNEYIKWLGLQPDSGDPVILIADIGGASGKPDKPGDAGGCRYHGTRMAVVDPELVCKFHNLAIAHELGHIFGLGDQGIIWDQTFLLPNDPLKQDSKYQGFTFMSPTYADAFIDLRQRKAMRNSTEFAGLKKKK